MAGLEKPTSGRIAIGNRTVYDGTPRSEIPAEERNLGLVFQSYALWPHKTVFDNVAYPLKLRKVAAGTEKERVQRVLDQLGLGHLGQPPSAPALRWPATAGGHRPGAGLQPAGDPAG